MNNFSHTTESSKSFDETVQLLTERIEANKFKVLHIHDVQATLVGKGIELEPYKIIEFCRAPAAAKVLKADPMIGLFLPCRMIIFEKDNRVVVSAMSPKLIKQFFPEVELGDLSKTIDTEIANIIDGLNL